MIHGLSLPLGRGGKKGGKKIHLGTNVTAACKSSSAEEEQELTFFLFLFLLLFPVLLFFPPAAGRHDSALSVECTWQPRKKKNKRNEEMCTALTLIQS